MRSQKRVKKTTRVTDRRRHAKNANKKLKKKQTTITRNIFVGKQWDAKKSVKQNMRALGLAYNPNDVVMDEPTVDAVEEVEEMDIDAAKVIAKLSKGQKKRARLSKRKGAASGDDGTTSVVSKLEQAALDASKRQAEKSVTRAHKDEVCFCREMITRHGLDFEAMSRDPNNIWQHTACQIRRMVDKFKKSPAFRTAH